MKASWSNVNVSYADHLQWSIDTNSLVALHAKQ